jgi:hypothetical protein
VQQLERLLLEAQEQRHEETSREDEAALAAAQKEAADLRAGAESELAAARLVLHPCSCLQTLLISVRLWVICDNLTCRSADAKTAHLGMRSVLLRCRSERALAQAALQAAQVREAAAKQDIATAAARAAAAEKEMQRLRCAAAPAPRCCFRLEP